MEVPQNSDEQNPSEAARALPSMTPPTSLSLKPNAAGKSTLYLGAFQVLAVPFDGSNLPAMMPSLIPIPAAQGKRK